jgi:pyridoxine kinase
MTDDYTIPTAGTVIAGRAAFKEWVAQMQRMIGSATNEHIELFSNAAGDRIEMLAFDSFGAFTVETPLLPLNVNGAGDMTAALFLAHWSQSGSIENALEHTTASVFAVLEATAKAGAREIQLIRAQESMANPVRRFKAVRVR